MKRIKAASVLLILLLPLQVEGQYQKHGPLKVGLSTDAVFSTLYQHGSTFYITGGNDCHTLKIGPRLSYNTIINNRGENSQNFIIDADYRINMITKPLYFNVYSFFHTEYGYSTSHDQFYYIEDQDPNPDWMRLGDGNFNVDANYKTHTTNFHIGLGTEIEFTDSWFATLQGGLGIAVINDKKEYTDLDKGQHISPRQRISGDNKLQAIASFGIGYRLAPFRRY